MPAKLSKTSRKSQGGNKSYNPDQNVIILDVSQKCCFDATLQQRRRKRRKERKKERKTKQISSERRRETEIDAPCFGCIPCKFKSPVIKGTPKQTVLKELKSCLNPCKENTSSYPVQWNQKQCLAKHFPLNDCFLEGTLLSYLVPRVTTLS